MIRKQGYPDFQWIQTISGQGELVTEGQTFTVNPRQGMLLFPDTAHEYYATKEPWQVFWVSFNGRYARSILRAFQWELRMCFSYPTRSGFCRSWKRFTRCSPELLLRQPDLEIAQIAGNVGYGDASYFIKLFKRQEGLTPKIFRMTHVGYST